MYSLIDISFSGGERERPYAFFEFVTAPLADSAALAVVYEVHKGFGRRATHDQDIHEIVAQGAP